MSQKEVNYIWENQKLAKECESIQCPDYDPYADFIRDPSGIYLLIKVNFSTYRIEVAVCNKGHEIEKIFIGHSASEIYHGLLNYEKKNKLNWLKEKTHVAYLGKELKKAEVALVTGNSAYFQE